ncbi:MAG: [Fe-S]-binding protein [Thermoprotei archaeon]|nr:MAG: [Fe-S]-binding protein [Thermoprotei archaeon]
MARRLSVVDVELCVGCMMCVFACSRRFGDGGVAKSAIRVASIGGIERGFRVIVCRACPDPPCAASCPTGALKPRKGGGVLMDPKKCVSCGNCVRACPIGAVMWDEESNKPIICVHCGICAQYCPYGVIELEEVRASA